MASNASRPVRRPAVGRFVVYGLLVAFGSVFLMPLVWLVSTALKPAEQTGQWPPAFLPRVHYAEFDGIRREVTKDFQLKEPAALIVRTAGPKQGQQELVAPAELDSTPARLVKMGAAGDWRVTVVDRTYARGRVLQWDVVPGSAIATRILPRWENFRLAMATLGGRSLGEVQGTEEVLANEGEDSNVTFFDLLLNTLTVCVLGVAGAVFSNALIAYGFARLQWPGRDVLFAITLGTMMVPFPVYMVPLYGLFKELGWIGTLLPLWVPSWFGAAFNIFLMRQFFRTIPEELSEAARIDGCSEWQIFWRVILPLSKPVLAVVALFHFLYAWNDFMGPLLYLTQRSSFTLALALQNYQTQLGGVPWHLLMAASTLVILPIMILFMCAQKFFVRGIATTGLKG